MRVMCAACDFIIPTHKEPTTIETKDKSNQTIMQFRMSGLQTAELLTSPKSPQTPGEVFQRRVHWIQSELGLK